MEIPGKQQCAQAGTGALVVGFLTLMVLGTDLFVVAPLLPSVAREYGVSQGNAGISVTAFSLAYVASAPLLGAQADRLGRRRLLVLGLVCFGVSNLLTGFAPNFIILVVSRVLAGMSAAAVTPSVYALTGQFAPPTRRGGWMAVVGAGLLIALATGAPAGTLVASVTAWNVVFIGIAILALLLAVVNLGAWPTTPASSRGAQGSVSTMTKIRAASVTGLWGLSIYIFYTYLAAGLGEPGGHAAAGLVATALVIYGVGAVIGSLGGGRLADRYGPGTIVALSLTGVAALQLVLDVLLAIPSVAVVTLGLFALTGYACFPAHQARLVAAFPKHSASVLAWNNSALYVGISVGSFVGGRLLPVGFWLIPLVGAVAAGMGALVSTRWAIAAPGDVASAARVSS